VPLFSFSFPSTPGFCIPLFLWLCHKKGNLSSFKKKKLQKEKKPGDTKGKRKVIHTQKQDKKKFAE